MEVKKGYKQTELGVIPEDWDVKTVEEIAPLQRGFDLPNSDLRLGPYPVVYSNGIVNYHNKYQANCPGIVTGRSGTIGKVTYVSEKYWPHNTSLWVTSFIDSNPKYVYYLFNSIKLERFATGSGVPTLNRKDVHDFLVCVPPLPEQKAIATALSDMDALIAQTEKLIEKKKAMKQGMMQELLKPKKGWVTKKLVEIGTFSKGSGINKDLAASGDIRCIRYGELYTKHHNYIRTFYSYISKDVATTAKRIKTGDILFAGSGETKSEIGKCVAYLHDYLAYAGSDIVILTPNYVNSLFLGFLLNDAKIQKQKASRGQGDAVVHISAKQLGTISIHIPPIREQEDIGRTLRDMDESIYQSEIQLKKLNATKQGMMQELLTGRIRLL